MVMTPTCRRRRPDIRPTPAGGAEFEIGPRQSTEFHIIIIISIICPRRRFIFSFHNTAYRKSSKNGKTGLGNITAFYYYVYIIDTYTHIHARECVYILRTIRERCVILYGFYNTRYVHASCTHTYNIMPIGFSKENKRRRHK